MKFNWSEKSRRKLETCDESLQNVLNMALNTGLIDMTVTCGHRGKEAQNAAYDSGHSKVRFPRGKHNKTPSMAVDVKPYIKGRSANWNDYSFMAGVILTIAELHGYQIRWGGNWDQDGDILKDQSFDDGAHFELLI